MGEFEDAVENWEPTTVRRESPDDGALKRVSDVTSITSKENKLDALDVCDCRETRTPKFNPDPRDNLAVTHESESQFRAENAVLDVALEEPSLARDDPMKLEKEMPSMVTEYDPEVGPF